MKQSVLECDICGKHEPLEAGKGKFTPPGWVQIDISENATKKAKRPSGKWTKEFHFCSNACARQLFFMEGEDILPVPHPQGQYDEAISTPPQR